MKRDGQIRELRQRLVLSALVVAADIVGLVLLAVNGMLTVPAALVVAMAAVLFGESDMAPVGVGRRTG